MADEGSPLENLNSHNPPVEKSGEPKASECAGDNGEEELREELGEIDQTSGLKTKNQSEFTEALPTTSSRESFDTYEVLTESDLSSLGDWEGVQEACLSEIPPIDPGILQDLERKAREVSNNLDLMLGSLSNSMRAMTVVTGRHLDAYESCVGNIGKNVDASINSMCKLIALCEQVDASMAPIHAMAVQIKEIKKTLDHFEAVCK